MKRYRSTMLLALFGAVVFVGCMHPNVCAAKKKSRAVRETVADFDEEFDEVGERGQADRQTSASASYKGNPQRPPPIESRVQRSRLAQVKDTTGGGDSNNGLFLQWTEIMMLSLFVFYIANYLYGSHINEKVATQWAHDMQTDLVSQFAVIGIHGSEKNSDTDYRSLLVKEDAATFKLFASGRRYCKGAILTLKLCPRQELFSLVYGLIQGWEDTVTIELPMNEKEMDPFVFFICPRSRRSMVRDAHADALICKEIKTCPKGFPDRLSVLTDCNEVLTHLLKPSILKTFAKDSMYRQLRLVHISDRASDRVRDSYEDPLLSDRYVRFEFALSTGADAKTSFVGLALETADSVGRMKLSKSSLKSVAKKRASLVKKSKAATLEDREAIMEQRREAKELKRRAQYDALKTDAERRKWEEKEAKRLRKKKMKRMRGKIAIGRS